MSRLQDLFISDEELSKLKVANQIATFKVFLPKMSLPKILWAIIIGGFFFNQFLILKMDSTGSLNNFLPISISLTKKAAAKLKLTSFDVALAKERMDKNNDGICDICGMPTQQCIDSGQLDCNMGNNPQAIGVLGSQHIHADFKVFINGNALDFAKPEYFMKSSFIHVDNQVNKDDASGTLHMHAKKVPLWLFFTSLGMNLTKDGLTLDNGRVLKSDSSNTLKFYLNGKKVDSLNNYIFQDLDKLLISSGPDNDDCPKNLR